MSTMSEIHANVMNCHAAAKDWMDAYLATDIDHYLKMSMACTLEAEMWEKAAE